LRILESFQERHWRSQENLNESEPTQINSNNPLRCISSEYGSTSMSPAPRNTNAGSADVVVSSIPAAVAAVVSCSSDGVCAQSLAFSLASLQDAAAVTTASSRSCSASIDDEESDDSEDDGVPPSSLDPVKRLARCRERNREHARRTRIRKKVQLEALQRKCKGLQAEQVDLKRIIEDRRVASILLNLSGNADPSQQYQLVPLLDDDTSAALVGPLDGRSTTTSIALSDRHGDVDQAGVDKKQPGNKQRKSPQSNALCISIDGAPTVFSAKSHVNWKTGAYLDRHGRQQRLDARQLDSLRYVYRIAQQTISFLMPAQVSHL
jgi:hypothetical protein